MKKVFIIIASLLTGSLIYAKLRPAGEPKHKIMEKDFYQLQCKTIDGETFDFKKLKGKKVLIVNVASYCGYTGQYKGLQELHEKFGDKLIILGFPCNQFGMQEPGSNQKIKEFCSSKFHVTFTMMDKCDVKGKDQHPIYQWLTRSDLNGIENSEVSWNFNKYLIDEQGKYIQHFSSKIEPMDEAIISKLK